MATDSAVTKKSPRRKGNTTRPPWTGPAAGGVGGGMDDSGDAPGGTGTMSRLTVRHGCPLVC